MIHYCNEHIELIIYMSINYNCSNNLKEVCKNVHPLDASYGELDDYSCR